MRDGSYGGESCKNRTGVECERYEFPNDDVQRAALAYHDLGLHLVPLRQGEGRESKKPVGAWSGKAPAKPQTRDEVSRLFPNNKRNIGVQCGVPSENLGVADFDSLPAWKSLIRHNTSLQRISSMTPVVQTRRGVHLWFRTPVPVAKGQLPDGAGDIQGEGGYVVAPPSLQSVKTMQRYLFEDGLKPIYTVSNLEELAFLGIKEASYSEERPPYYGIGWRMFSILGGETYSYHSRSQAEQALIVRLASLGWNAEEVLALFLKHAKEGTKFRELGGRGASWLYSSYENALEYLAENRREVDRQIDALHRMIDNASLPGRTKWTDRAIYRAALQMAREAGKLSGLGISTRQLAEYAGVSQKTAVRSLHRLETNEMLTLEKRSDGYNPSVYTIPTNIGLNDSILSPPTCEGVSHEDQRSDDVSQDAYRVQALGKTGAELVNFLNHFSGYWWTIAEIERATSLSRRSVERKLKQLHYAGLTESTDAAWGRKWRSVKRIGQAELDAVAERTGAAGKAGRQRAQHRNERIRYREVRRIYGQARN